MARLRSIELRYASVVTKLVAIDFAGGPEFVDRLQSIWDAGDAVLPLDPNEPSDRQIALATSMGTSRIEHLDSAPTQCDSLLPLASGDAAVLTTSGTSGGPKGVILTHDALLANAVSTSESLESDSSSWWLACLPLNHIGGFSVITRALLTGAKLTVIPKFDPAVVSALANDGCTHVSLVTTAAQRMDTSLFSRVLLGGSAPPSQLVPNMVTGYGMTETCGGFVHNGYPLSGAEVRIEQSTGQILAATTAMMRCYRDGTDPTIDENGVRWLPTGDIGELDSSGKLSVTGRSSDMIITGGENVWPAPIEDALGTSPLISEAAIIGLPNDEWGEVVTAVVVASPGSAPTLEHLADIVRDSFPRHCVPRQLVLADALPRTSLGKLQRSELRSSIELRSAP